MLCCVVLCCVVFCVCVCVCVCVREGRGDLEGQLCQEGGGLIAGVRPRVKLPCYFYVVPRSKDAAGVNICHLAELDSETLYLYGPGSLDALDRNWGSQAVSSVCTISFKFIDFDNIVPHFHKISVRFPSLAVRRFFAFL